MSVNCKAVEIPDVQKKTPHWTDYKKNDGWL